MANLAMVRAATEIRETFNQASSFMRSKLTTKSTEKKRNDRSMLGQLPKFHSMRPTQVSTNVGGVHSMTTLGGGKVKSTAGSLIQPNKVPTTAGLSPKRKNNSTNMSAMSIESSEVEEEKLPPFLGSVESHLHKEYNQF